VIDDVASREALRAVKLVGLEHAQADVSGSSDTRRGYGRRSPGCGLPALPASGDPKLTPRHS